VLYINSAQNQFFNQTVWNMDKITKYIDTTHKYIITDITYKYKYLIFVWHRWKHAPSAIDLIELMWCDTQN